MDDLKIYDETSHEEITDPDLTLGYVYEGTIVTGHVEAHEEVMEDTVNEHNPNGLRRLVPAKDIVENCKYYHAYTEEDKQSALTEKETELSNVCNTTISAGSKVKLTGGDEKQFSYAIEDQSNVSEMFNAILMGATSYPYHADGESCQMYSAADIVTIYSTLSSLKTAQITYYNQLRQYVRSLEHVPEIEAVKYGDALTGEYLETYNTLIQQAGVEMQKVLSRVTTLAS